MLVMIFMLPILRSDERGVALVVSVVKGCTSLSERKVKSTCLG